MDQMLVVNLGALGVAAVSALAALWQANEARNARDGAEEAEKRANDIALSTVEALKEANRLTVDRVPELMQVAYERMLRALRPVTPADWSSGKLIRRIQKWAFQMLVLAEMAGDDQASFGPWLEAERQRGLAAADEARERIDALDARDESELTADDWVASTHPYNAWAAELANNLRMWRAGRLDQQTLKTEAEAIERDLKEKGKWVTPMSWRSSRDRQ